MKAIETEADYDQAMEVLHAMLVLHAGAGLTLDQEIQLGKLAEAIEVYEKKRWPIDPPTAEERAAFRKDQETEP